MNQFCNIRQYFVWRYCCISIRWSLVILNGIRLPLAWLTLIRLIKISAGFAWKLANCGFTLPNHCRWSAIHSSHWFHTILFQGMRTMDDFWRALARQHNQHPGWITSRDEKSIPFKIPQNSGNNVKIIKRGPEKTIKNANYSSSDACMNKAVSRYLRAERGERCIENRLSCCTA